MRRLKRAGAAVVITVASMAAPACAPVGPTGGQVTILVSWSGTELAAFNRVITDFEHKYRVKVTVESTRGLTQELGADLSQDDAPDVAALPSIGAIGQYVNSRELKSLNGLVSTSDYGQPWSALMRPGGGPVYAVPVKVDVKSLVWYDPAKFRASGLRVPTTWNQLLAFGRTAPAGAAKPWCLAVASPPVSGWPGADWIADILLNQSGPLDYQKWVSGTLPWTSGPVRSAFQTWNRMIDDGNAVYGRGQTALTDSVGTVNPASFGCYLAHGTLVDEGFAKKVAQQYGTDYAFFTFPSARSQAAIEVSADFMGMFNDTKPARELVQYLASAAAQRTWVSYKDKSGFSDADGFSANNQVKPSTYPNAVTRSIAATLTSGGRQLCFGAADAMSPDLSTAFYNAVLEDIADPGDLGRILGELSQLKEGRGTVSDVCGPA